jgi:hypothetical protein
MWASRRENTKPARRNESKVWSVKAFHRPEIPSRTERAHPGGVPRVEGHAERTQSPHVGTRKMVTYA